MKSKFDWSFFIVRINVKAPKKALYKAWATRAGIEYWFLRMGEYKTPDGVVLDANELVKPGDLYSWRWFGYPDTVTEYGKMLELNGVDFFKFSFGKAGNCAITLLEEQGETIVQLLQDQIPVDEHGQQYYHIGCKTGWTFYLANMKSMFEGGIDLRNKNEQLQDVINS